MSRITASSEVDNVKSEDLSRYVDIFFQDVTETINGRLDFQTNFNGKFVDVSIAAANSEQVVSHGLNRTPAGYIVTSLSAGVVVYNGASASTAAVIYLRATGPCSLTVFIF